MTVREITREDVRFVERIARRTPASYTIGLDDAIAAGLEGLWRAALAFDPTRGRWPTCAWDRVRGAIIDEVRRSDHLSRGHRRLIASGHLPRVQVPVFLDTLSDSSEMAGAHEPHADLAMRLDLEQALAQLPGRTGHVMRLLAADWDQVEIAGFFGVSEARVSKLAVDGRRALRDVLAP